LENARCPGDISAIVKAPAAARNEIAKQTEKYLA
jgi:hypothetical protein